MLEVGGYHLIKGDFRRVTALRLCLDQRNGGDKDRDERKGGCEGLGWGAAATDHQFYEFVQSFWLQRVYLEPEIWNASGLCNRVNQKRWRKSPSCVWRLFFFF